jgi:DEAD/DEAH box helicase domain-containing protein
MSLTDVLSALRLNRDFMANVVVWQRFKTRSPRMLDLPLRISPQLLDALQKRSVTRFYTHQAAAIAGIVEGSHVVIATPTASGKSLCYTVPVLDRLLSRPTARALYVFPTKALSHDQMAETTVIIRDGQLPIEVHVYDGDTPQSRRQKVRRSDGILITNPDMLHAGILPYHTSWRELFSNLEFVVLDEIHGYRGIFGSHVANVLRRLHRICEFYGSKPQFICCSATIANPKEHAERLVEKPFMLVDESQNGAPTGEKHFILYNPPIIDERLGLRSSTVLAVKDAALTFLSQDVQTIVFARARQTVELILAYLRDELAFAGKDEAFVAGYRGGYLPLERREIESGLRTGEVRGVVATNALELGIDIGELDVALLTGYPGSIASTWQQAGRAGRRADQSVSVLVAGNSPLDQYICNHPRYLFGRSPEHALTNPDNIRIITKHMLCASFELPFRRGEAFGDFGATDGLLEALQEEGLLYQTREQYHWMGEGIPTSGVSLRTSGDETAVIHDISRDTPIVIGEVDLESVPLLVHEGAIYMHQARTFLVEMLDWPGRIAHVRPVEVDYYTRASVGSTIRQLMPVGEQDEEGLTRAYGDVSVVTKATGYRKIKRYTHETLGFGEIDLPEILLETAGYWMILGQTLAEQLYDLGVLLRPNDYGPNWQTSRQKALERDEHRCRSCGASDSAVLHVHHVRPFREFGYVRGKNENYRQANDLGNLMTLCSSCHRRAEAGQQTRSALGGLGYVLRNLAPLFLMCDVSDIEVIADSRNPITRAPTVVVYERVAAGVGFSKRLFDLHAELLSSALELVMDCRCGEGCPACVGPPGEIGPDTKGVTVQLLRILTGDRKK